MHGTASRDCARQVKAAAAGTAREQHRRSVDTFISHAESVAPEEWELPLAPGKWSPAQVAEHLRLTYEVVCRELEGGEGIRLRSSWWLRPVLRLRFLPMILRGRRLPAGARAPREIRPGAGPFPRTALLQSLRDVAARAEETMADRRPGAPGFTHHVFGRLQAGDALRFAAVHNEHHTRQIAGRSIPAGR